MEIVLVMFKSDGTRRDFPLVKRKTMIGRTSHCDLRIPLSSVSREHCEIVVDQGDATVRDLGSSNGTYHNRRRIQQSVLAPGDELAVGPVIFTVMIDGEPIRIDPVRVMVGRPAASVTSKTKPHPLPVPEKEELTAYLDEDPFSPTVDLAESNDD